MSDLDNLTGILKKSAVEVKIASLMNENRSGALLLCDVDHMKRINNQYGHLIGDECLKDAARILTYMIREGDVLGRCGGDEFFIFVPKCGDLLQAEEICNRIEKRFRRNRGQEKNGIALSMTAAPALWRPGDTCQILFERAYAKLQERKMESCPDAEGTRKGRDGQENDRKNYYAKDVKLIRKELIEEIRKPGAYCQDYETFKGIYRFLERGIIRSGQKACVILLTVVDGQGRNLSPDEKDVQMGRLGEDIRSTLRIGDVYTRYSSNQYLVLVIDTTEGQGDLISNRIKEKFLTDGMNKDVLIHNCYELQPAKIV